MDHPIWMIHISNAATMLYILSIETQRLHQQKLD